MSQVSAAPIFLAPASASSATRNGPAWEIATLFPDQGSISQGEYLWLTDSARRLVEFSDGRIEVLQMPTTSHQLIVQFLNGLFLAFCAGGNVGTVLFSPLRVRLRDGRFREPDLVFMLAEHSSRIGESFWDSADLVVEVVSKDDPERDLVIKRTEYAEAKIPEYWIVDPRNTTVTVLVLEGVEYKPLGDFAKGQVAVSSLLNGFAVDVKSLFAAANL